MLKLQRYVGGVVIASMLLVLMVIAGLDMLMAVMDQVDDFQEGYGFAQALWYTTLTLPGRLFETLPFAALVGCLVGLGSLATSSELVVIQAAGVSVARITWSVLRPALLLIALGMLVAEYVAPQTQQIAESYRSMALQEDDVKLSQYGLWHREGNHYMHFNAVQPNGVLYGVSLFEFNQQQELQRTLFAERATFQQQSWLLEDVRSSQFVNQQVETATHARLDWQTGLRPELLNILVLDPEDLPISGLWSYSQYLQQQGMNAGEYRLAFWNKVFQPLAVTALVLVAVSFVFGPLRQVTVGFRIFTGVLVGIVFRTVQDMLAPASLVFGFEPIYAALAPILICFIAGGWLLSRRHA